MRLGPVLEAIINGRYYWVPFMHLVELKLDAPEDLRDAVWMPAQLQFTNGGETVALIPTRYVGSDLNDPLQALSRKTEWVETLPDFFVGRGQRLLTTDVGDLALMDLRSVVFEQTE